MSTTIDTERFSRQLRARAVDRERRALLVSRLTGSAQEEDISEPVNCDGFGRVRHFRREGASAWPQNPLPIDPATNALGLASTEMVRAQVFQNAVCNWRCWYCYVPFDLLSGNPKNSAMLTTRELVDLYLAEKDRPQVLDLSGGQPDLVPEWIPWMMEELMARGLHDNTYLWSDDNLSNDYFWRYLTTDDIDLVARYSNYGRVCCFKGFDSASFTFNTLADDSLFEQQFRLMARFIELGIDLYAYVTFTTPSAAGIAEAMARFVDRLQAVHPNLPLRTIPLKIEMFSPVEPRMDDVKKAALVHQLAAVDAWLDQLQERFTAGELAAPITAVSLGHQVGTL